MNISIRREDLIKPLSVVAGVVERRQTLPILSNVLVRQDERGLSLTGTDLEVEISAQIPVQGERSELTLPAKKLFDICKALPADARIDIATEKDKAVVKSGKSRFRLLTMPSAEFPVIEAAKWEEVVALPQQQLKWLLEKTMFCMAQQDVRYYLNGLLLEFAGKKLRAVATDGHRLALAEVELPNGKLEGKQVIVPRKGVQEMTRFLENTEENVEIQIGSNHLRTNMKGLTFTSKLIDGRFPDYNKVIPASQSKRVLINRDVFRETLNRAAILSNEKYRGVRFGLSKGMMTITAHNPEQEEAQEELAVGYSGEDMEIGFNVNYIADAASALDTEEVEFGLNDPNSSCLLRAPDNKQHLYVVMPMRL